MKRDRITKRREKLARMAERAAIPERPIRGTYIIRPAVSAACAPSLQAIAAALRDPTLHIDEKSLEAASKFFTDGRTALYGYDVTDALRATVLLQQKIVRPEPIELDEAPVVVAKENGGQLTRRRKLKKLLLLALSVGMLAFATAAFGADLGNYFDPNSPPANHHVHDCTLVPSSLCRDPHLGVGFFPTILGETKTDYLQDPAECNDATDKSLLPPNDVNDTGTDPPTQGQPWRAGVCYTRTTLIHLRSIDADDPAPAGWFGPIAPTKLGNGVTYVTYWLLTPR